MSELVITLVLTTALVFANRIIGDSEYRKTLPEVFESRVSFILGWCLLVLLSAVYLNPTDLLYICYSVLSLGLGFWWFRQIIGPDAAFQAGHGGEPSGVSSVTKQWDVNRKKGLWQGALVGMLKVSFPLISSYFLLTPWGLLFILLGISYGLVHRFTYDYMSPKSRMREHAEYIIGGLYGLVSSIVLVNY